jgi:hypothetical protein
MTNNAMMAMMLWVSSSIWETAETGPVKTKIDKYRFYKREVGCRKVGKVPEG